jgi:uncharacterized membrane protein YhiD involved in acid resistance
MIENLQAVNVFSPSVADIVINVLVSLVCSIVISIIYRFTYRGPGYSGNFVNSIVFLSVITSLVIMVIGNNLARAFGLVGALSIIRFRTAIKDTVDIVYIFLALAIGMAGGVGYHKLAFTGTIIVGLIFIILSNDKISFLVSNQYMLQFVYSDGEPDTSSFMTVLMRYCKNFEIINIRSNEIDKSFEYSYYVRILKNKDVNKLVFDLQQVEGIKNINFFFDQQNS